MPFEEVSLGYPRERARWSSRPVVPRIIVAGRRHVIERLVPEGVVVASTREDLVEVALFPEEEQAVASAVEKRRST